jgi:hypothetical protein
LQDDDSLNETTKIDVEETGSVLNTHQDASKEDGMNTDSKDKETPIFAKSNKVMGHNFKVHINRDNEIVKNTKGNIVKSPVKEENNQIHNSKYMEEVEN